MASRDIELCNQALIKLGSKLIANYTDNATGILCDTLFTTSLYTFSTMFSWTWNEKLAVIDAEADPDPEPIYYTYSIPLPTDFIQMRIVKDEDTHLPIRDYDFRTKKIYCNYDSVIIRYASTLSADDLPRLCDDSFSSYLAHRLAPSLEDSKKANELWSEFLQKAQSAFMEDASQRSSPLDEDSYYEPGR